LGALGALALVALVFGCSERSADELPAVVAAVEEAAPDEPARGEPSPAGRWRRLRGASDAVESERLRELIALGYARGSRSAAGRGVTRHDRKRAFAGYNLYTSGHAPEAVLMDMSGRELHRWRYSFPAAFPSESAAAQVNSARWWRRAVLLEDGDLYAIFDGHGLLRLAPDSSLRWARLDFAHHDLALQPDGGIAVLTRQGAFLEVEGERFPVIEDFVSVLDGAGRERDRISVVEAFERSRHRGLLDRIASKPGDLLHTNAIERLDGQRADVLPAFREGNWLLSMRKIDAIAVLDPEARRVVWAHTGRFAHPHDPSLLENGNLLLFDNDGAGERSRVIELDPRSGEWVWVYEGSESEPFYSRLLGAVQRLPNGNTLITESDNGRAFEVTSSGEIVWEFYNPHTVVAESAQDEGSGEYIATLSQVLRLPPDFPLAWLPADPGSSDAQAASASPR
jgi:hypothetical protein